MSSRGFSASTSALPDASTSRLSFGSETSTGTQQLPYLQALALSPPPVANAPSSIYGSPISRAPTHQRRTGQYGISSVLVDESAPASLLPAFPSLASNPYVPNSFSSLGTAFSSGNLPRSASGVTKSVAQRRSRAPPVVVSEIRKVLRSEFDHYLDEVRPEWERWEKERRLGREGAADLGEGLPPEGEGVGLGIEEGQRGRRRHQEEELPPLDEVPQIFFDPAFNLSNPRTFDLVTERIQLTPGSSPRPTDLSSLDPLNSSSPAPGSPVVTEPIPGLGPLTLADLATDQILQEKLSHYTAVIETHLVREIGLRSSSFFSALSNLQHLHHQGEDCLAKISELHVALSPETKGVGAAAKRGLQVLRSQARRRGLERIEEGMRAVEEVWAGVEEVKELVEQGEWMGALEVGEQVEAMYYGAGGDEIDDYLPHDSQHRPSSPDAFGLTVLGSPSTNSTFSPKLLSPAPTTTTRRTRGAKLNLTRIKALDSVPHKLALLRAEVAKSLEAELVGVLDHEMEVSVEEYIRLSHTAGWKSHAPDSTSTAASPLGLKSPVGLVASPVSYEGNGVPAEHEESGEDRVRERAKDRARPVVTGLVRAEGMDGAVASWRESVLRDVRSMVREYLPTTETPTMEEEDAFAQSAGRASLELGSVSEKSLSLAKKLKTLSPAAFLALAQQTYLGLLGTIEVIEIHSKVILELYAEIRATERLRRARRRGATRENDHPATNGSMLAVPGSPRPTLTLSTSIETDSPNEDSTLASDIPDVLHAAAELANLRFSKVIGVRTEVHANLSLVDFVAIFDASWNFVVQCEVLCQRMIVGLRGVMVGQAKLFLQTFHQKRLTDSARLVENEQWTAADVTSATQKIVNLILQSAVGNPVEFLLGQRREARRDGTSSATPAANGDGPSAKQLDIEGREYFAVSAGLSCVEVLADYLMVVMNCPLLTTDAMSKVVEFMKSFNSRTCQVVLGAGAMRSAGLKNITAKHLALASQALSIMISLIPYIRETLRRHLNPKQAVMLIEFDKLKRDYQEHQNEIHAKLVAIMSDRLQIHCKSLEVVVWEQPAPGRKEGAPNAYMEALVKEHMTLHKVLSRFLQEPTVDFIMGQVFSALNLRLAEEFSQVDIKSEAARGRMLVDATYLKAKLAELKGMERDTPGTELQHLIEAKETPESTRSAHARQASLNTLPHAALSPVIPSSAPDSPPSVPIRAFSSPPPPSPPPPLPVPVEPPLAPPPAPVRRKSMAERLAELSRKIVHPVHEKGDLPTVPEPDVEEVPLVAPNGHAADVKVAEVSPSPPPLPVIEETPPRTPDKEGSPSIPSPQEEVTAVPTVVEQSQDVGGDAGDAGVAVSTTLSPEDDAPAPEPPTVQLDEPESTEGKLVDEVVAPPSDETASLPAETPLEVVAADEEVLAVPTVTINGSEGPLETPGGLEETWRVPEGAAELDGEVEIEEEEIEEEDSTFV